MQKPSFQTLLDAVRKKDTSCVPSECVVVDSVNPGGNKMLLIGSIDLRRIAHPEHVNKSGESNVYIVPITRSKEWCMRGIACVNYRRVEHACVEITVLPFYNSRISFLNPSLDPTSFRGDEAKAMGMDNMEMERAYTDFLLFVWEQKTGEKLRKNGTIGKLPPQRDRDGDGIEPPSALKKGKGRKRDTNDQSGDGPCAKRRSSRISRVHAADEGPIASGPPGECQAWQASGNQDDDDEELPPPVKEEKKHIILIEDDVDGDEELPPPVKEEEKDTILIEDDVEETAVRSTTTPPSTSEKDKDDLENLDLELEKSKIHQTLLKAQMEEVELKQKRFALMKKRKVAETAAGELMR